MKSDRIVIELSALHVERDAVILDRIDWRVRRGENWAILGANGSGKTSMLRVLTGYLPPTSGEIRALGETYGRFDWRILRERIGLVTHHVEEIVALCSHVLILKAGAVLAAGPRARVLNSSNLSLAFDAPVRLANRSGRYSLTVRPSSDLVM